jgi:hypothetical protein
VTRPRAVSLVLGLVFACVATWLPGSAILSEQGGLAHAQTQKQAKPKPKTRAKPKAKSTQTTSAPKTAPKGPPPRAKFTLEDQAAAIVPGFPNARVWGDTAAVFR